MKIFTSLRLTICALLVIICSSSLNAQKHFQPGYIIKANGDTTSGFVSLISIKKSPELVYYKQTLESSVQKFTPLEIKGFGFGDLIFNSISVSINKSFPKNARFSEVPIVEYEKKRVFLESLVDGSKKLYQYIDSDKEKRFYIDVEGQVELLLRQEYVLKKPGENIRKVTIKKYLGMLQSYLSNCQSMVEVIKKSKYVEKSLIKVFRKYYDCNNNSKLKGRIKEVKEIKPEWSIMTGMSSTKIDFSGFELAGIVGTDYPRSNNFTIGGAVNLFVSPKKKWSFNTSLLYTRLKTVGEHEDVFSPTRSIFTQSTINFSHLKFQPQFHYNHHFERFRIFGGIGVSMGFVLKEDNHERVEQRIGMGTGVSSGLMFQSTNQVESGPVMDLGLFYEKYFLRLKLEFGDGISRDAGLDSNTTRFYLLTGILL